MGILDLPNELLLEIGEDLLIIRDLFHFLSTNRRLSSLLTPHFRKLQDAGSCPILLWAVIHGDASLAERLISKGAKVDELPSDSDGKTALHLAAEFDYPDIIRILVKHGAQIDARERDRQTPLHTAVSCRSPLAIRVLLELGADTEIIDRRGRSPARLAARLGLIDSLRPFVDAGFDFTHINLTGRTILHDAILRGREIDSYRLDSRGVGMVNFILEHGGEKIINAQDSTGATPLREAVFNLRRSTNKKLYRLLLSYGAVELKDNRGNRQTYWGMYL